MDMAIHSWQRGLYRVLGGIMLAALLAPATAQSSSKASTPVLVELFTSEGCSSCPPADALLQSLDRTQPISGVQLIVLSEHVDYWDGQGWRDPFSSHALTLRQSAYADRLRLASAYTPQMVVDGGIEFVGSDRARATQALEKAGVVPKVSLRISSVKVENGKLHAHIETDTLPSKAEVFVALALDHAQSQVLRGENGGHHLEHVAVVRTLRSLGNVSKATAFAKDVEFALDPTAQSYRLIAFVQEPNQGRILGAALERVIK
jgi:hypothetical protein